MTIEPLSRLNSHDKLGDFHRLGLSHRRDCVYLDCNAEWREWRDSDPYPVALDVYEGPKHTNTMKVIQYVHKTRFYVFST